MSLKKAAEDLLKIADEIEKDAAGVTQFVCDKCNHTATLAGINGARQKAASDVGENVTVSDITVEDKVACPCPSCDGVMSYQATDESKVYYFEEKEAKKGKPKAEKPEGPTPEEVAEEAGESPAEQAQEESGEKLHKEPHKKEAAIDYDSLERYSRS